MSGMSNVTRTRTGCRTCRRRRKKCDERKPMCRNCEKTNLVCEGFPPRVRWQQEKEEMNVSSRRASEPTIMGISSATFNAITAPDNQDFGYGMSSERNSSLFHQPSSGLLSHVDQAYHSLGNSYDDSVETIFTPLGLPPMSEISQPLFGPVMPAGGFYNMPLRVSEVHQEDPQSSRLVPGLPLLIPGIETATQQRLICHFASNMSQVLTACSTEYDPMNTVVIQLGLRDATVMDSILCLSASHLLKIQGQNAEQELLREKKQLHDSAVHSQVQRTQTLVESAVAIQESYAERNPNMIFATSILLCLYEICEGTGDEACQLHLDMARQIITSLSRAPERNANSDAINYIVPNIDPFLLEFFVYHDSMASVTLTSLDVNQNYIHRVSTRSSSDITMIGVQDGLVDFVPRIAALRNQAKASKSQYDGNVISNAVAIWEDLNSWKHKSTFSPEYRMMAEFYQWSLFIWLFSIINPEQKSDRKIQDAVQRITSKMLDIKDNVRACLLFPLFVVGSAAISPEDRGAVEVQFRKLRDWSALGNVDLSYQVIESIWKDHDDGVAGSWDWVSQLKRRRMSFIVT